MVERVGGSREDWPKVYAEQRTDDVSEQSSKNPVPTFIFCLVFYLMAAMMLCIEFLPPEAQAIFGGNWERHGDTLYFTLPWAALSLLIAVALHVYFYRRNRERFDVRAFRFVAMLMAGIMAADVLVSIVVSRTTGLPPDVLARKFDKTVGWLSVSVLSFLVLVGILVAGYVYFTIKYGAGNRMASKIESGDFAGAIRIGEARPPRKRDFLVTYNLAVAYGYAGEMDKARKLQALIEQTRELPKNCTQEVFEQFVQNLRKVIEEGETAGNREP